MKKLLVFLLFAVCCLLFADTPPAFANGWENDCEEMGGRCKIECDAQSEEQITSDYCPQLSPPKVCCRAKQPQSSDDCPEGKTYVAIFRACVDFGEFAGALINWLMIIAAGLAIIKIAAGGIQYIFASGDPKNLENAHATMTSAIVGLMLVLLAWVIMKIIGELTPESWQIRLLGG